jgi:hypothetical protein
VEQLVPHRQACFELVGFIVNRAQRSSERLNICGSVVNVEGVITKGGLALRRIIDRELLPVGQGRYNTQRGALDWRCGGLEVGH